MKRENGEQKDKFKKRRLELLAPAGSPAAYIAAVENGADAVYLGGKQFNARMNAENFTDKELESAIDYGHLRGVKSYVAVNTLLTDGQLAEGLEYAKFLYRIGADGLILQDMGLGYILKQVLPDLPLHLSTQGSIYDLRGVEAASSLGYERVVLARELSLEEIQEIAKQTETEIEVFVHGALCFCYSGQCQLSRFIGGRSGNLGGCAQPCRLPYQYLDPEGKVVPGAKKYPLSPKDLCLVDELDALAQAGVSSFKIEGRMKSPQYVAVVTSVYRKYLDLARSGENYTVAQEDRDALRQIFNRGGFTKGYFYHDPEEKLLCDGLPKHQGVRIGEVAGARQEGARQKNREEKERNRPVWLADIKMIPSAKPLQLGDGIEIHGNTLTGNVITYLQPRGANVFRIGDLRENPPKGAPVYKITSRSLMEQAEQTFKNLTFSAGKYKRQMEVKAVFRCEKNSAATLEITEPVHVSAEEAAASGQIPLKRATKPEEIRKQLEKTGGTPFRMAEIAVKMEEPLLVPVAGLNALRRKTLQLLEEQLREKYKRILPAASEDSEKILQRLEEKEKARFAEETQGEKKNKIEKQLFYYNYDSFLEDDRNKHRDKQEEEDVICLVPAKDFTTRFQEIFRREKEEGIQVCPYIPAVIRGKGAWLEENFQQLAALLKTEDPMGRRRRIFVGNLNWISPFAKEGIQVSGNPELNIYNRYAFFACRRLGLSEDLPSFEDGADLYGFLPLMITEHEMTPGWLTDRKKEKFFLYYSQAEHKSYVLGEKKRTLCRQTKKTVRIYVRPKARKNFTSL